MDNFQGLNDLAPVVFKAKEEQENTQKQEIVLIMGAPGAGKGTQSEELKKVGYTHISTGDVFRDTIKWMKKLERLEKLAGREYETLENSKFSNKLAAKNVHAYLESIRKHKEKPEAELADCITKEDIVKMREGELMSDRTAVNILFKKLEQLDNPDKILLDGFPRSVAQAEALDAKLAENNKISKVINLEVNDEVVIPRIVERGRTSGRADDQDKDIVRNRLKQYHDTTEPVLEYYRQKEGIVMDIDGDQDLEVVTQLVMESVDKTSQYNLTQSRAKQVRHR